MIIEHVRRLYLAGPADLADERPEIGVRRPSTVEAVRYAHGEANSCDGIAAKVLCIEEDHIAEVAIAIINIGHNPAVVFRDCAKPPHEHGLERAVGTKS